MKILLYIATLIMITQLQAQVGGLQASYEAGDTIHFFYEGKGSNVSTLITHSFGRHLIVGKNEGTLTTFKIPIEISQKSGHLSLIILQDDNVVDRASTTITALKDQNRTIESYCGPKHLVVGISDHSMICATILDPFDNPYPEGSSVDFRSTINGVVNAKADEMENLVAYNRFYAPAKAGYGALTTSYAGTSSKEFRLTFYANDAENFSISISREHAYADGNQMISMNTSIIKDRFSNLIENGTLVEFRITTSEGKKYMASSETIGGVASLQLPAPDYETAWTIQAFIPEYAKSDPLKLDFLTSLKDFSIQKNAKELVVGPLIGYMGQFVKEGTPVKVKLHNETSSNEFTLSTQEGVAVLNYEKSLIAKGTYEAIVEVANINKSLQLIVE